MKQNTNLYFQTLIRSWKIAWHNKFLWFFALFSLVLGSGQWHSFLSKDLLNALENKGIIFSLYEKGFFHQGFLNNLGRAISRDPFSFLMILLLFFLVLLLFVFLIWIAIISQAGLIFSIAEINKRKKIDIHKGMAIGRKKFWPVLSLYIVIKFIIWTFSFLLGILSFLVFIERIPGSIVWLSFLSIIIIVFLLLTSFISKYSLAFIVLQGKNFIEAIKDGFKLFFDNWVLSLEIALFLLIVDSIFVYLAIWAIKFLLIPIISMGIFSFYFSEGASFSFYIIFIPILLSLFILWVFSVLVSYNFTVWITVFMKITSGKKEISSIIGRLAEKIKNRR